MNVRSGSTNIDDNNFNLSQFTTMAESIFEEYSNQLKPTIFFIILQNSTKQNSQNQMQYDLLYYLIEAFHHSLMMI